MQATHSQTNLCRTNVIWMVVILVTSVEFTTDQRVWSAPSKSGSGKSATRRENQPVQRAREDVNTAEKSVKEAEKLARKAAEKLSDAEREQGRAASKIQKLRNELQEKFGEQENLPEKRRKMDEVKRKYNDATKPIIKQLSESPRYQGAVAAAEDADKKLSSLRTDKSDDPNRLKQIAELTRSKLVPSQLEREALEADKSLDPVREELKNAEAEVTKANDAIKEKIDRAPELKEAQEEFQKSKADVLAARKDVDDENRHLARTRQKLGMEMEALQRKINADIRDNNTNRKGRPKR